MFEDSLLNGSQTSSARRTTSTMMSLAIQAILLAGIVALPLFKTEGLPTAKLWASPPLVPPAAARGERQPVNEASRQPVTRATTIVDSALRIPSRIPRTIDTSPEPQRMHPGPAFGVPGGDPNGKPDGVLNSIPVRLPVRHRRSRHQLHHDAC